MNDDTRQILRATAASRSERAAQWERLQAAQTAQAEPANAQTSNADVDHAATPPFSPVPFWLGIESDGTPLLIHPQDVPRAAAILAMTAALGRLADECMTEDATGVHTT